MRVVLVISYDGTNYGGWQIQKNCITVQEVLERAAGELFGTKTAVVASGRTDSGVHAAAQVCHMDVESGIAPEKIATALNVRLPGDICVLRSFSAPEGFDANRSAKRKTYVYRVYFSECRQPLKDRFSVWVKGRTDIAKLRHIAGAFEGEHDFKAYLKSGSQVKTTVRTVYSVEVVEKEFAFGNDVEIRVTGNGFLYNMVRTIAGTMINFAQGAISEERVRRSLEIGERGDVGKTMPAKGLTLESVEYDGFSVGR